MRLEIQSVMVESIGKGSILYCEVCHVDEIENELTRFSAGSPVSLAVWSWTIEHSSQINLQ